MFDRVRVRVTFEHLLTSHNTRGPEFLTLTESETVIFRKQYGLITTLPMQSSDSEQNQETRYPLLI